MLFWIELQLDILSTSAVNRSRVTRLFSCVTEFIEKDTPTSSLDLNVVNFSHSTDCRALQQNRIETLSSWSAFYYTAESDKPLGIKRVARWTAKRAAMVFMVHSRHVQFMLTYRCIHVVNFERIAYSNWTSCTPYYTKNEINWHFWYNMVSLNLCKEYLNMVNSK